MSRFQIKKHIAYIQRYEQQLGKGGGHGGGGADRKEVKYAVTGKESSLCEFGGNF